MKGQAFIDVIVEKSSGLTKCRRQFLSHLLTLFLRVRHRINFLQPARHTDQYCEHSMRLHFEQSIDLATINQHLIQPHGSGHFILALDASCLPKSGKATPGFGSFFLILPEGTKLTKNDPQVRQLYSFGCMAA